MSAENDVKTAKIGNTGKDQFPFFTTMLAVIMDILSDAKFVKKYENLIKISEKYTLEKFYALYTISTTRFAGYFHNVLQAMMADMKERSKNGDKDATFILTRISTVSFLALLTGMIDIYDVMGELCGVLQIVNRFIWERKQAVISYLEKMIVMVDELHSESNNTSLKS